MKLTEKMKDIIRLTLASELNSSDTNQKDFIFAILVAAIICTCFIVSLIIL